MMENFSHILQRLPITPKKSSSKDHFGGTYMIHVDIGGHPPFPAGSKQLSSNFDNLLFLAVFRVLNFQSRFEALNDVFWGMLLLIMKFWATVVFLG
jgi:hypothetical protein